MADPRTHQTELPKERDHAGVIAPPPAIYSVAIVIGLALHYLWPIRVVPTAWQTAVGVALALPAVALFVWAVGRMVAAGTQVPPHRPSACIVKTGPYRFTRNPIYLSLTMLHLAIAVWVNSVWLVAVLVPTLVVMSKGVIAREERYLAKKFGHEYLQYKSSVRRWL